MLRHLSTRKPKTRTCPLWQREGDSPIFADFAARIGTVPVNGYTLRSALAHRMRRELPRIGGSRIGQLFAEVVLEVVPRHLRSEEHLRECLERLVVTRFIGSSCGDRRDSPRSRTA